MKLISRYGGRMMKKIIEFKKVSKVYGDKENQFYALRDASFDIFEGEFVVILGPSGAGKSTLLNLLGGMDPLTSGEIKVDDQVISQFDDDDELTAYRAKNIGFIFQFYNLIPTLTAIENVGIVKDITSNSLNSEEVLASVNLKEHMHQFPSQLSGGEQQRVSIARAISKNPLMLLCDEPTGALDSETGVVILSLLHELCRKDNKTVIIVTHNAALAPTADRVIHIKNGKVEKNEVNEKPLTISEVVW